MFEEHPSPPQFPDTDLFLKEVTALQLQSKISSFADLAQVHQSEYVPDICLSGGTESVDAACNSSPWACDDTSWVPSGLVDPSPGLAFDDDMSVISGGGEVMSPLLAQSLDGGVHVEEVLSGVALLKNDAEDDACSASANSSVPAYLNIVSPERKSRLTSFFEPRLGPDLPKHLHADMSMVASEASVREPHVNILRCHSDSDKDTLWYKNYRALKEFKEEYGHTNVPQEYCKNPTLGNWVKYNRQKLREWNNSGSKDDWEKMSLLIEIGMKCYIGQGNAARVNGNHFSPHQVEMWEMQFMNLCKYKEERGNCDVPSNETGKWKSLGEWVKRQRKVYRKFHSNREVGSRDLIERFERLNKIGFKFRIGSGMGRKREVRDSSE